MAKLNSSSQGFKKTTNKEGHVAYSMADKNLLVNQVLTSFFGEKKFYGDNSNEIIETATRVARRDPEFVANLAVFARREFHMRSISHVLTAILAKHAPILEVGHDEYKRRARVRSMVPAVVVRADDITEILAAYLALYGKPIPNSLKRGLGDAMKRFDEYALSKYKGEGKTLKMRDVLRICHPQPGTKEQSKLWKRLINKELETPFTWETELSAHGNTKEVWEGLIQSDQVGYMALLRNLRNIINAQPYNINKVYTTLADPEQVRKSKQLPFRFLSAYKELEFVPAASSEVFDVLETAIDISVENMERLPGRTAIVVDVSGSMSSTISSKSQMRCAEVGLLLGVIASRICEDSIFLTFSTSLQNPKISSRGGILTQAKNLFANGGGTNMNLPFDHLIKHGIFVDRIIILSDNEVNGRSNMAVQTKAAAYRREVNTHCWVHAIDLQGYGTQQFDGPQTNIIAGWSEKVLQFILLAEAGVENLTKQIADYRFQ